MAYVLIMMKFINQGHRCKFKQIYMIIGDDKWEDKCKEELITVLDGDCAEQLRSRNGHFSTCSKWEYPRNYTKNSTRFCASFHLSEECVKVQRFDIYRLSN